VFFDKSHLKPNFDSLFSKLSVLNSRLRNFETYTMKIMTNNKLIFSLILGTLLTLNACGKKEESVKPAAETVTVIEPYIRAMPPGQKVTAMFMSLNNPSLDTYALVKAESDVSDNVELHEHVMKDGMMQMGQVEQIEIKAQGNTQLKPGGYHVMLIGLKKDLDLGQKVPVKLTFKDGSTKTINPEVKKIDTSH